MKTAIVTGASSGVGKAIADHLQALGFRVAGIARWSGGGVEKTPTFDPVVLDLRHAGAIQKVMTEVLGKYSDGIDLLVNAAGFGRFPPHREIDPVGVEEMVAVNLTAPMILCRLCLPAVERRRGKIVNVSSITARHLGKRGAAYAATKAGLLHFSRNLFEEVRKSGVGVTTLLPDLTDTAFYDALDFAPAKEPDAAVAMEAIVHALQQVIEAPSGTVIEEVVLRPQLLRIEKKRRQE